MGADKDLGFSISKCCRASFRAVLTDKGKWMLRCEKCGECCAILKENFQKIKVYNTGDY